MAGPRVESRLALLLGAVALAVAGLALKRTLPPEVGPAAACESASRALCSRQSEGKRATGFGWGVPDCTEFCEGQSPVRDRPLSASDSVNDMAERKLRPAMIRQDEERGPKAEETWGDGACRACGGRRERAQKEADAKAAKDAYESCYFAAVYQCVSRD